MSSKPFRPSLPTIQSSYYGDAATQMEKGFSNKIGGMFGADPKQLPMYKDKPEYGSGKRKKMNANKIGLVVLCAFGLMWISGLFSSLTGSGSTTGAWSSIGKDRSDWKSRKNAVREAFITSWDHYAEHAWGMDVFHPVSTKSSNMGCKPGAKVCPPTGWIIVDGLDTAIMMNLTSRVAQAREWISTSLDFSKVDSDMSTFETTIRVLGGLLSAHWLSTTYPHLAPQKDDDVGARGEDLYIEKAVDLADRLMGAYDTPTGIPLSSVILNTSTGVGSLGDSGAASIAEATTLQLEMKYLSKLTGEPIYWQKAEKVMEAVDAPGLEDNLLPIFIDPKSGRFRGNNIRLGSRGDSYYEYLIKQYLQTGSRESVYLDMWEDSLLGMKKHLITWSEIGDFTILGERQAGLDGDLTAKMDHLVCFLPGTIALGVTGGSTVAEAKERLGAKWTKKHDEDLVLAEELAKTCWGMYYTTPTGLAPEITYMKKKEPYHKWNFNDPRWTMPRSVPFSSDPDASWRDDFVVQRNDRHNLQRPETAETLLYMWRITGDVKYREWGWSMFESFMAYTAILNDNGKTIGYTSINNVFEKRAASDKFGGGAGARIQVGSQAPASPKDNMEGFWLAETLKYLYLLFSDDAEEWHDLRKVVINTEAHFLPRFDIGDAETQAKGVWKTGWERKKKQ